jgi:uncharacterized protein YecE (DUF72 family)
MPLLAGTSGWQYKDWRGPFYPEKLAASRWLEHYAETFPTVENNGTFYRLAAPDTFAAWQARTPDGFRMAIKASRYLTHIRRLRDPAEPVGRLMAAASRLGSRLGPVLLQLPPTMQADAAVLDGCIAEFHRHDLPGRPLRLAVEFRHPSWWTSEVRQILQASNTALCWVDRLGRPQGELWRTADWGYLRLHEGAAEPWPRYGKQALRTWLRRIADTWPPQADVYAYFNNDQHAAAPADATELGRLAHAAGLPVPQWQTSSWVES